jgi:hypothetical protein
MCELFLPKMLFLTPVLQNLTNRHGKEEEWNLHQMHIVQDTQIEHFQQSPSRFDVMMKNLSMNKCMHVCAHVENARPPNDSLNTPTEDPLTTHRVPLPSHPSPREPS